MNTVYVERTKEQIIAAHDAFEDRATMFLSDFRNRRVAEFIKPARQFALFGFKYATKGVDRVAAEQKFDESVVERALLGAVVMKLNALREVFMTAKKADSGTKFYLSCDDARWFFGDHRQS